MYEAGVLAGEERIELESRWKAEFERAQSPDAKARRRHYREADIPRSLVEAWTAERQRQDDPKA